MDSLQILIKVSIYSEKKNIVAITTLVLVAMVMNSWKNMDHIIRNMAHYLCKTKN